MTYAALNGNAFQALGAVVQPERGLFVLMFFNAKKQYQLHLQRTKGVTITIDGEKFYIKTYKTPTKSAVGKQKIEGVVFDINKEIFEKLVKAKDVTIRVGIGFYNLDQDNIDAFEYFGAEVEKDIKRRSKTKPE